MRLLLMCAVLSVLAGCRPPESAAGSNGTVSSNGVTVAMEIDTDPTVGPAPLRVNVDRNGKGVGGAAVEVIGEMTHAGMEPVTARAHEVEPGVYVADEFEFNMAGDWIVTAEVSLDDGEQLRAVQALYVEQR